MTGDSSFHSLFRGSPSSIFQSPSPVLLRQYRNQASGSNRNTTGTEKEKERRDNSKTSKTSNKNKKGTSNNTTGSVVNDSDVEVIEPNVQAVRDDPFAKSSSSDNGDNEIECTGTSGMNAIVDFPHHRDLCVIYKFSEGNHASFCEKCYCVVCEIPASECKSWNLHCDRRNSHYKEREAEQQRHEDGALARLESLHGNRTMD
ncbi:expressed unknown protein [Seminavis robusta]|uniref:Uncharacterized protein n=1 Tax=Seminavis robusta TaxID=568900 RepID=A0A9N8EFW5_9STRA|nr:expressed unknown protein [Seminavis robusta]|eukprot:Sro885_g216030.1 n/a (202) ;mRNA; r:5644-6249